VQPAKPLKLMSFDAPRALGTTCTMWDDPNDRHAYARRVLCESVRAKPKPLYMQKATLPPSGVASICRERGLRNRCRLTCGCREEDIPVLPYGSEVVVGRFRCESLRNGIRCTVAATGKGFLINRNRAARVG
jgi:hypothetical protein